MKEFVLVEFLFTYSEAAGELRKLNDLGGDFEPIKHDYESEEDSDAVSGESYIRISGKINSETASLIKLQNPVLAGKMRISYISEDLKNKYRE
jgi:hypothetical protein